MNYYRNSGGDSGVYAYETGADFIIVQYSTGAKYLYTYASAGRSNIEKMKTLAVHGSGLNSFINTHVKHRYAKRVY